ncbi:MAG: hypothetical protein AAF357_09210, partial [Verrucomicrobiota bacterium]
LLNEATRLAYYKQQQLRSDDVANSDPKLSRMRATLKTLSREDPLVLSGKIAPNRVLPPPLPPTRRRPPPLPT